MITVDRDGWTGPDYREQVAALAEIAAQAATLQPGADTAVAQCGGTWPVPDATALELGRLSSSYSQLYERVRRLDVGAALAEPRDELRSLLSYHLHMLRDAGDLAFSGRRDERTEPFRQELTLGLGPYATRLLRLAAELRGRAEAPQEQTPSYSSTRSEYELDDVYLPGEQPDGD
ncbi:MAG TPA: hypothetical protein VFU74_10195 [Actinocrinis sp.]|nr:hypothetical protein [Actinocrinis sp.]